MAPTAWTLAIHQQLTEGAIGAAPGGSAAWRGRSAVDRSPRAKPGGGLQQVAAWEWPGVQNGFWSQATIGSP